MGALDITHYSTWTTISNLIAMMCLFSFLHKAYNMNFVVRVLAGFELASLNRVERANEGQSGYRWCS